MERLTFEGNFCDIAMCQDVPGGSFCENGACSQRKVWERLKAYEDTGLEPEEVNSVKLALMGKSVAEVKEFEGVPIDRLRELAQADKEGRCEVLPCKVGDTVWRIQYVQNKKGNYVVGIAEITFGLLWLSEFGKTVFLTREEAEKALGGGQDEPLPEPPEEE